ncbi:DUF3574 domain-containing protein [Saccharopolyspora phatthalungensis]|uniref:Choline dehydrogenase n=1 Tax=Saccharopolyspora phatthalungensis TaxID=664693 RepID=A0A840QCN8_9PSEU|nr:DUF3574 domain-containing protein [Saccharopolyspora phatthalungensis]MBB5157611.1 hypothetical protein [Saccharopolyspora phatthalungensis]
MTKRRVRLTVAALAAAFIGLGAPVASAAFGDDPASAPRVGEAYVETSLFFGTARPGGGQPVTDDEFRAFVDGSVTPQFPAGLTVQDGYGQYRDVNGMIERERSYELTLFYLVAEYAANDPKIERIRAEYNARFGQESVARVDDRTAVDF